MSKQSLLVFALVFSLALLLGACAGGGEQGITVKDVWARQSPTADGNSAAYMIIGNGGQKADALIGVSTDVAAMAELHEMAMENEVMKMRPVAGQRIEIPAGGSVELKPGGLHVMLMGLNQMLEPGKSFKLTLKFEKAGDQTVTVEVRKMEGMDGMEGM